MRTPLRLLALTAWAWVASPGTAQAPPASEARDDSLRVYLLDGLNVTAVRGPRSVFVTPAPVSVVDAGRLRRSGAANVSSLFLGMPGLDGEGVGPAQRRPVVRGMRGQRVLLLEDGLRLNNVRRRVDSGEPTGLVWSSALERVEVVRGPSSVLYGSDAVGGVVNLVTRQAPGGERELSGFLEAGGRSAGSMATLSGELEGGRGPLGFRVSGGARDGGSYRAPAGTFGGLTLTDPVEVHDSGVSDRSLRAELRYALGSEGAAFLRHERYRSEDSGFGWIDPGVLGAGTGKTRLWWPEHDFRRTVLGVRGSDLAWALVDDLDVTAYTQRNERSFLTEVSAPVPGTPGMVDVRSENFTNLGSHGLRAELRKLAAPWLVVTYGLDAYEDRSTGTDSSTTTVSGLGPTTTSGRGGPQVPDARMRNVGLFVQGQLDLSAGTELVVGTRLQDVRSRALATPGNDAEPVTYRDRTLVGTLSVLHSLGESVKLLGSVGRGFRTPNLVERFFTGLTGSGRGFWEANPDLRPETSVSFEAGARLRWRRIQAEAFLYQNTLFDGIVLEPTGEEMGRAVVYRNVNVDELRYRGLEATVALTSAGGLTARIDGTIVDARDRRDPDRVLAETYPDKVGGALGYQAPDGRFWVEYAARRNGGRETLEGTTPVGDRIPAFTVHDLRGGVTFAERHELTLAMENLTNTLYAEALNTGFFRPEPGRGLVATWRTTF